MLGHHAPPARPTHWGSQEEAMYPSTVRRQVSGAARARMAARGQCVSAAGDAGRLPDWGRRPLTVPDSLQRLLLNIKKKN